MCVSNTWEWSPWPRIHSTILLSLHPYLFLFFLVSFTSSIPHTYSHKTLDLLLSTTSTWYHSFFPGRRPSLEEYYRSRSNIRGSSENLLLVKPCKQVRFWFGLCSATPVSEGLGCYGPFRLGTGLSNLNVGYWRLLSDLSRRMGGLWR